MLHDALSLILGCHCSLTTQDFAIHPSLKQHLHPAELNILQKFAEIGQKHRNLSKFADEDDHESLYNHAIAQGVSHSLMDIEREIVELEAKMVRERFQNIIETLGDIVDLSNRGCRALDGLSEKIERTSHPERKRAIEKAWEECMNVFRHQLMSWMLYGRLWDPYKEFFVSRAFDVPEDLVEDRARALWTSYQIVPDQLPSFISAELAGLVLGAGRASLILGTEPAEEHSVSLVRPDMKSAITFVAESRQQEMWESLTTKARVLDLLQNVKNLYLGGQSLIFEELARIVRSRRAVSALLADLNRCWLELARTTTVNWGFDEEFLLKTQFKRVESLPPNEFTKVLMALLLGQSAYDDKEWIGIYHFFPWPTSLIFDEHAMALYSVMWLFMFLVATVKVAVVNMDVGMYDNDIGIRRWRLIIFMQTYNSYIQEDIVSPLFASLTTKIQSDPRRAHLEFLEELHEDIIQLQARLGIPVLLENTAAMALNPADPVLWLKWEHQFEMLLRSCRQVDSKIGRILLDRLLLQVSRGTIDA